MTDIPINPVAPRLSTVATGGQVLFTFPFIITESNQLVVERIDVGASSATLLVEGTDYTVTGVNNPNGGSFSLIAAAYPSGATVGDVYTRYRSVIVQRLTDFAFRGNFSAELANAEFDRMTLIDQERQTEEERSVRLNPADPSASLVLPLVDQRKSLFLACDASGNITTAAGTSANLGPVSGFIDTLLPAIDAPAARTTLDAVGLTGNETVAGNKTFSGTNVHSGDNVFSGNSRWTKGADIASATTLVVGTDGNYFDVTGTTTITGVTVPAGLLFMLHFDDALTLTNNASWLLPGNANIVTVAGDRAICFATAADTVEVLHFQPIGLALVVATQAEMEAATASNRVVPPSLMHSHPGVAKAWVNFDGTGTPAINDSYNVTSITDNGTGDYTVNFTTAFSNDNYAVVMTHNGGVINLTELLSQTTSAFRFKTYEWNTGSGSNAAVVDPSIVNVVVFGGQ